MLNESSVFADVIDGAPLGIVVCRLDGTIIRANERARAILYGDGGPRPDPLEGDLPPFLTGRDFQEAMEILAGTTAGESRTLPPVRGWRSGLRLHRLEGDAVAVFLPAGTTSDRDPAGEWIRVSADAEGFPPADEVLRRAYPFGSIATFDEELRYLSVDGRGWDDLGIDPADLAGRTFHGLWDRETADRLAELAGAALRGFEAVQRVPYGGRVYEIWTGPVAAASSGALRGMFISHEVTAQVEQRARARLLQRATDAATMGIIVVDIEGADAPIVHVSGGFERLTGYRKDEVLGRNCRFLQGPETDGVAVRGIREAIERREPHQVTLLNYRKDGTSFWNRLTLTPFDSDGSEPTHYVGIQEDVTEIRESELARDHRRRLAEVGTLAGSVAHDFNNLLMEIRGRVDLCDGHTAPDEVLRELGKIRETADRGSVLVEHLLAYASRGNRKSSEGPAAALVREVVPAVRRLIPRGVAIEVIHPDALLPVPLSPVQLEQVLLNLAKNAADAMPDGGRIRISVEEGASSEEVVLTFSDTGTGIPPDVRERIFEPFFTTKGSGGTGLGLSSVADLVGRTGGSITLESEEGRGTTFEIRFPRGRLSPQAAPDRPGASRQPPDRLAGLHVLVAEDQAGVREVLTRLLERHGLRVTAAADGAEAWHRYRERPDAFDIVLADRDMPALGGDRLVRRILDEDLGPAGPPWLAIMSGDLPEESDLPEGVATVQKPFEIGEVLETLQEVVRGSSRPPEESG